MTREPLGSRELGGADPLDTQLGLPKQTLLQRLKQSRLGPLVQRRAALGLRPGIAPAIVLVPMGMILGPQVLDVLSFEVLAHLQVGISVGLALLGIFIGRALTREIRNFRIILAGNVESAATVLIVATALWFLITRSQVPVGADAVLVALCLAVTAAASSGHTADPRSDDAARIAARVADFDDLLLIGAGAVLLVLIRGTYGPVSPWLVLAPIAIGAVVAVAGLLLFEHSQSESERGLLVLGAVSLLGGASAYLMTSSLASGVIAGLVWTGFPGRADEIVHREAQKLQHPMVALLLVAAGAFFVPHAAVWWLVVPYVMFRLVGKILGAIAAVSLLHGIRAVDLASYLVPPGVIGVGFSLTFMGALPFEAGRIVVSVAAAGTLLSEVLGMFIVPATSAADASRDPEVEAG